MLKHYAGISPEELSLLDAFKAGQRAGVMGLSAEMNEYISGCPEAAEWERGRVAAIGNFLAQFAEAR